MAHNPVIRIEKSLENAMSFKNSPINRFYDFSGVQLLPNNTNPYIQVTNTAGGINLEDWTVKVMSMCGDELGDITDSFMVESLTNSLNGDPQFFWSLSNIAQDFGWDLVYLKIIQAVGETFYTSQFRITDINKEKTSYFAYKQKRLDTYQSIGFSTWFRKKDIKFDIATYYEESTKQTVTSAIKINRTEKFRTENMCVDVLIQLLEVLTLPYVYIDSYRCSVFTAPEIPEEVSQENFANTTYLLSVKYSDTFTPTVVESEAGDFLDSDFDSNDFSIYN